MYVVTAYLNGKLDEEVYMEVADQLSVTLNKILSGVTIGSKTAEDIDDNIIETTKRWVKSLTTCINPVCRLRKALYGLKQSGLMW